MRFGVVGTRKGQMACATSLLGIIEDNHAEAIHFRDPAGYPAKLSPRKGLDLQALPFPFNGYFATFTNLAKNCLSLKASRQSLIA